MPHSADSAGGQVGETLVMRELCNETPLWVSGPMCKRGLDLQQGFLKLWIHRPIPVCLLFKLGDEHKDCHFKILLNKGFTPEFYHLSQSFPLYKDMNRKGIISE